METLGNTHELGANVPCRIYRHEVRLEVDGYADDLTGALVRAADSITSCGKIGACARPTRKVPPTESLTSRQWR